MQSVIDVRIVLTIENIPSPANATAVSFSDGKIDNAKPPKEKYVIIL